MDRELPNRSLFEGAKFHTRFAVDQGDGKSIKGKVVTAYGEFDDGGSIETVLR